MDSSPSSTEMRPQPATRGSKIGDDVMVYFGEILHKAHVVGVQNSNHETIFEIKYDNWSSSWNQKVYASAVFEHNSHNLGIAETHLQSLQVRQSFDLASRMPNKTMASLKVSIKPDGQVIKETRNYRDDHAIYSQVCEEANAMTATSKRSLLKLNTSGSANTAAFNITDRTNANTREVGIRVDPSQANYFHTKKERYGGSSLQEEMDSSMGILTRQINKSNDIRSGTFKATAEEEPYKRADSDQYSTPTVAAVANEAMRSTNYPREIMEELAVESDGKQSDSKLFRVPKGIENRLIFDWKCVVQEQCLVLLPKVPNVFHITQSWLNQRTHLSREEYSNCEVLVEGILAYFDAALPSMLLYKFERNQYDDFFNSGEKHFANDMRASRHYGAEHLARFLLKMGDILQESVPDRAMLERIAAKFNDFVEFFDEYGKQSEIYSYHKADPEYVRRSHSEYFSPYLPRKE